MTGNVYSYTRAAAITPSDTLPFGPVDAGFPHARGLYIGAAGSLKIKTSAGDIVTYANVGVGWLYVETVQVFATGTTASDIVAHY